MCKRWQELQEGIDWGSEAHRGAPAHAQASHLCHSLTRRSPSAAAAAAAAAADPGSRWGRWAGQQVKRLFVVDLVAAHGDGHGAPRRVRSALSKEVVERPWDEASGWT